MKSAPNQKAEKVSAANQLDLFAGPVSPAAIVQGKALDQVATRLAEDARPPMPRLSVASQAQPSGAQQLPEFTGDPRALKQGALLDVRQAAAWLGLSKSTLDKMRCYGIGPRFIRATSRAIRYDPRDLHDFAAARRQSTSEPS